jgi:hypothetical protein
LVFDPGAGRVRTGFFQSVDFQSVLGLNGVRRPKPGRQGDAYDGRGANCREIKANAGQRLVKVLWGGLAKGAR